MATNYAQICEENIRRYGTETAHLALLGDLYSERTHFIFELLQNAEDAQATQIEFRLGKEGLELSHDGRQFSPDDVRGIASICRSTNQGDPERIGRFGIGFKSVYAYTTRPEIHSGDEHFAIQHYVRPQPTAPRNSENGASTLIVLPFNAPTVSALEAFKEINSALARLDPINLLFLRRVQEVVISTESAKPTVLQRKPLFQLTERVRMVGLGASGSKEKRWLVFDRPVSLAASTGKQVIAHVEVAFQLTEHSSDKKLTVAPQERATLAVFFPTDRPTATGFILQGPYIPTPARDNIRQNDPVNAHLVKESAELVVEALRWLRDREALSKEVLSTLPLKRGEFPEMSLFRPLFDRVLTAIKEEPLLPAWTNEPGGAAFVSGQNAKACASTELRDLFDNKLLAELVGSDKWRWLSDKLTVSGDSDLARYLCNDVGIVEIGLKDLVGWLQTKDGVWWKALEHTWLVRLYRFLSGQKEEHKVLKQLPIIRLASGEHVSAEKEAVFFPAINKEEAQELAPFLPNLPIIEQSLIQGDEGKIVENFLRQMGVVPLVATEFVRRHVIPRYKVKPLPTVAENRTHLRFLKQAAGRIPVKELDSLAFELKDLALLICRRRSDSDKSYYVEPKNAYLPFAFTGENQLELFFRASENTWFVDFDYISKDEQPSDWRNLLTRLGAANSPRITEPESWHRKDREIEGLKAALDSIAKCSKEDRATLASAVWGIVTRLLPGDGDGDGDFAEYAWGEFLHGRQELYGPRGGYHGSREFDARFFTLLRDCSWMPNTDLELHPPAKLFEDNKSNRQLLGETIHYLHPEISLKGKKAEWLAGKFGVRRSPTKESVLSRLKALNGASANLSETYPLYEFLDRSRADVSAQMEQDALVLCPSSQPQWLKPSQAFWEDESAVFGPTRGYLKKHYPNLRDFFIRVGVTPNAGPGDYVTALMEIARTGNIGDAIYVRFHRICKRLAQRFEEGGDWQTEQNWVAKWKELRLGPNWFGKLADKQGFWPLNTLVRMDNEHLAGLFEGKLPFWPFRDLHEFVAEHLGIVGCSSVVRRFQPVTTGGVEASLSDGLRANWPFILAFLRSEKWKFEVVEAAKSALAGSPLVRQADRITVTYELMGVTVEESQGKTGFFDAETTILWLAKGLQMDDQIEAIGDALQEFFGPEVLREFVCDLFRRGSVKSIEKWRRKGLILSKPTASDGQGNVEQTGEDVPEQPVPPSKSSASQAQAQSEGFSKKEGQTERDAGIRLADTTGPGGSVDHTNAAAKPSKEGPAEETALARGGTAASSTSPSSSPARATSPQTGGENRENGKPEEPRPQAENQKHQQAVPAAPSEGIKKALQDTFNKQGKTSITDDRPESGSVRNPAERRERTRENYAQRKANEVAPSQRVTRQTIDVWDPKNKTIRDFLYEEYGGRCQICGELNWFPRRDGKAYFEAVYLIPHTEAAWTDEPGSVVSLCALCSAKFQHGTVDCQDIAAQIRAQKTAMEGGTEPPSVSMRLIGKAVTITFSERHLIEIQELLGITEGETQSQTPPMSGRSSPHAVASGSPPTQSSAAGQSAASGHELVQCKKCPPKASWIRRDRLQMHILKAHGNQPKQGPQKSGGGSKSFSVGSSSLRRCRSCGGLAVPGHDYCYSCQ
jgi:hypothetical protein